MFRAIARLVAVLGFEAGAMVWLFALGRRPWLQIRWSELGTWIKRTAPEDAVAALIWLGALACVIWLSGSTLLHLAAQATRVPALIRSVEWITLPAIRKVTEGACAAILATSMMTTVPVWADAPPPVVALEGIDGTILPPGISRLPEPATLPDPEDKVPQLLLPREIRAELEREPGLDEIVVEAGDNLWSMSRRHLITVFGRVPTNQEITPYWRRVIARNQPNLISGNPDLIYSGEVIEMPPAG